MKAEDTLFIEVTLEESATVSGGDAAQDLINAQISYLQTNKIPITSSGPTSAATSSSSGSGSGSGSQTCQSTNSSFVLAFPGIGKFTIN